jgi:5-methylcytosine-specific restriction endonuclease McrA
MSTFLSECKGFTPVIDVLAKEVGMMTALVYGIVWRYCQMEDGICYISRRQMAEHAQISVRTVERHLERLCEAGYLKQVLPIPRDTLQANDGTSCGYCKVEGQPLDRHHIIPRSEGGSDNPDNIVYLCSNCHRQAHNMGYVAEAKIYADGWKIPSKGVRDETHQTI